jgi:hypothetical protein
VGSKSAPSRGSTLKVNCGSNFAAKVVKKKQQLHFYKIVPTDNLFSPIVP